MTRDEELLNDIIQRRGYLVVGSRISYRVGERIPGLQCAGRHTQTETRWYILESTDVCDIREQAVLIRALRPDMPEPFFGEPHFYRVLFD